MTKKSKSHKPKRNKKYKPHKCQKEHTRAIDKFQESLKTINHIKDKIKDGVKERGFELINTEITRYEQR